MPRLYEKLLLLCALTAVAAGCKPKIGEDCKLSRDCSAAGDRLCDITAPGGYCTIFNCEPGTCPDDESLCVEFGAQRSPICEDKQAPSPYARTFCMATCDKDSDCRDGYRCQDLSKAGNDWGALLIDTNRGNKACVVQPIGMKQLGEPGVCKAEPPMSAAGGSGGGSSSGGSSSGGSSSGGGGTGGSSGDAGAAGQSDSAAGTGQGGAGE